MRGSTVGLGLFTGQRPEQTGRAPYRDAPVLAAAAERAGFDAFWVSEHHGWEDDYLPSPLTVLAAAAITTERITLATGVALAPFYHPVALAEQAAVVDHLSEGRLLLGLGLGYVADEYAAFGVDPTTRGARLEQLVGFLRAAWRGEVAHWTGHDGTTHSARVTPQPQRGTIPIWLGGYADAAIDRACRVGDGYLLGRGDPGPLRATAERVAVTRPSDDPTFTFGVNLITILDDAISPGAAPRQAFARQQRAYERRQRTDDAHAGRAPRATDDELALGAVDAYVHAAGDPQQIVTEIAARLSPVRDRANVHVVLRALFPEPDLDLQLARVERLGREVLPHLRAVLSGGGQPPNSTG